MRLRLSHRHIALFYYRLMSEHRLLGLVVNLCRLARNMVILLPLLVHWLLLNDWNLSVLTKIKLMLCREKLAFIWSLIESKVFVLFFLIVF